MKHTWDNPKPETWSFGQRIDFAAAVIDEVADWDQDYRELGYAARQLRMLAEKWRIQQNQRDSETEQLAPILFSLFGPSDPYFELPWQDADQETRRKFLDHARELVELGWHRREADES